MQRLVEKSVKTIKGKVVTLFPLFLRVSARLQEEQVVIQFQQLGKLYARQAGEVHAITFQV